MLWSKPTILYDMVLDYRIEDHILFAKYWQLKNDPALSVMRAGRRVCVVKIPPAINHASILWQHLFLDPFLKDLQTGWHLCLLPRHMIVVIKEGLYVCERLVPEKVEQIESTKTYMYRFGYEPDIPLQIHDWRQAAQAVTVSPHYKGLVLQPYQPWYKHAKDVGLTFFRLFAPYITSLLGATLMGLSVASLYYGYQNYVHDWDRIRVLQAWPDMQSRKSQVNHVLQLAGLFDDAKAPLFLVKSITINDKGIIFECDDTFTSDKNLEVMRQFLKKYYPYPVTVRASSTSSILLEKPHSLSYQAKTRHKC
ncbi:MAG: hypothetical protein AAB323_01760 [Pseudomonadota bacterium]